MSLRNIFGTFLKTSLPNSSFCNSVRLYGRWTHRRPAKVFLSHNSEEKLSLRKEKVIELSPEVLKKSSNSEKSEIKIENNSDGVTCLKESKVTSLKTQGLKHNFSAEKTKEITNKREQNLKKRKFYLSQSKVFDDNNEIIYEKFQSNDGRISTLLVSVKSKKERLRSGQTLVEGWRLIADGLQANCALRYIIFSRIEDLDNLVPFLPKTGVKLFKVPYKDIELWSDVETSPGVFGIFETPTPENIKRFSRPLPLHLICDNIRVPGNLGAILRAAVGAGCDKVLLSKGCVDVWDPKVIRSGAGAHFRLPIHHSIDWMDMPQHLEGDTSIFIADSNTQIADDDDISELPGHRQFDQIPVLPYYGVDYTTLKHVTLLIGGETEGIGEHSYRLAASRNGLRLNIPLQKGVDSLNTGMASAIITFEIRKQFLQAWSKAKMERQMTHST